MYEKNLTKDLRLRLSDTDMDFLKRLSDERGMSVSSCIRGIIGEYRRSLDAMAVLTKAIQLTNEAKEKELSNGDTKTYLNNQL